MPSPQLDWFNHFLTKLSNGGWAAIFTPHGWDITAQTATSALTVDRTQPGLEEFALAGNTAICAGDPSLSLLYHALMHPGVQHADITYWPDISDIDALENYIYGLAFACMDATAIKHNLAKLYPIVMAYEYRITSRTPHKKHADLIFSRTGVGRVGTHEPEYDASRRCFNTAPTDNSGGARVQPARYGLFMCEAVRLGDEVAIQGRSQAKDKHRTFYKPVYKLYNGLKLGDETLSITFNQFHQSDKLARMVKKGGLKVDASFDINSAPFTYNSNKDDIVGTEASAGNIIVWRKPQTMCRAAEQNNKIVTFEVPKESLLWLKSLFAKLNIPFFYNNRRYTSLRVGQNPLWAIVDYGLNALFQKLGSSKRAFMSPRHAGEFTNIRHILDDNGQVVDLNFTSIDQFKSKLSEGGYQAIMYEDPVAEGFISANIAGISLTHPVKAAYSLMTAPDFMPRIGNIDIYQYNDNFLVGGSRALCEGRLAVNLRLTHSDGKTHVFEENDQTVTAITAINRKQTTSCAGEKEYNNTHYLSDEASDIFAPGWDVTYTRDELFSTPYYHTSGLGSPFLEDVKLCAAANGMWPAASPDAARTFKRSTRTAFPLTDIEIGIAHECALAKNLNTNNKGWDGEYGPFIAECDGTFKVNYASIERSDYISNYDNERFDFAKLREINRIEGKQRLQDLAEVNKILLDGTALDKSGYWLVSHMKVTTGNTASQFINAPDTLIAKAKVGEWLPKEIVDGYFYIFASYSKGTSATDEPIRRIQPVDEFVFVITCAGKPPQTLRYKI